MKGLTDWLSLAYFIVSQEICMLINNNNMLIMYMLIIIYVNKIIINMCVNMYAKKKVHFKILAIICIFLWMYLHMFIPFIYLLIILYKNIGEISNFWKMQIKL